MLALITNFVTLRLRRLPIGRAWEAMREDEIACRSLGINTTITKLTAFATGAMFGGFAGSFFATRQGFISPESFTFMESAIMLAIVVLGGLGSQIGVVLAAIVMIGGFELLRNMEWLRSSSARTSTRRTTACSCSASPWSRSCSGDRAASSPRASRPSCSRSGNAVSGHLVKEGPRMRRWQTDPVLKVEHLTMRFGGLTAVDDVSFDVGRRTSPL